MVKYVSMTRDKTRRSILRYNEECMRNRASRIETYGERVPEYMTKLYAKNNFRLPTLLGGREL